jgi:excisionase family DNA binding protein
VSATIRSADRLLLYSNSTAPTDDYYMDVPEAAKALGVGRSTLYDAIRNNTFSLRYVKVGSRIRISRYDVRQATGRTV